VTGRPEQLLAPHLRCPLLACKRCHVRHPSDQDSPLAWYCQQDGLLYEHRRYLEVIAERPEGRNFATYSGPAWNRPPLKVDRREALYLRCPRCELQSGPFSTRSIGKRLRRSGQHVLYLP
jgi:hypothetical protein